MYKGSVMCQFIRLSVILAVFFCLTFAEQAEARRRPHPPRPRPPRPHLVVDSVQNYSVER